MGSAATWTHWLQTCLHSARPATPSRRALHNLQQSNLRTSSFWVSLFPACLIAILSDASRWRMCQTGKVICSVRVDLRLIATDMRTVLKSLNIWMTGALKGCRYMLYGHDGKDCWSVSACRTTSCASGASRSAAADGRMRAEWQLWWRPGPASLHRKDGPAACWPEGALLAHIIQRTQIDLHLLSSRINGGWALASRFVWQCATMGARSGGETGSEGFLLCTLQFYLGCHH